MLIWSFRHLIFVGIVILSSIVFVVGGGCVSTNMPAFTPQPKTVERKAKADHPNNAEEKNALNSVPLDLSVEKPAPVVPQVSHCFTVNGPVLKLEMTPHLKNIAVLWRDTHSDDTKISDTKTKATPGSNWALDLWNIEYNTPFREAESELGSVRGVMSAAFDKKGKSLYIADADSRRPSNLDGKVKSNIRVLFPEKKKIYYSILSDSFDEERIRLSYGTKWIACKNRAGQWRLVDREEPERVIIFPEIEVETASEKRESKNKTKANVTDILAFSPNGEFVATFVSDQSDNQTKKAVFRTIVIWDLQVVSTLSLKDAKKLPLETFEVSRFKVADGVEWRRCAFSHDGRMIAVRSKSKYIGIWQTSDGHLISELGEHRQPITSLQFMPNNIKLIVGTGGEDGGRVTIWDIRKEMIDRSYAIEDPNVHKVTAVTASPDNARIYFGTDTGLVMKWQLQ